MSTDIVMGSAAVGLLVGMTGAGGGALMTPMLVLVFSVKPSAAISSDLLAAVLMRPVGSAVHFRRGTVNLRLAGWMSAGSVPAAVLGAYLLHLIGHSAGATEDVQTALGAALLLGGGGMVLRHLLDRRAGHDPRVTVAEVTARPLLTFAVGVVGGLVVGMTSVGAGSLMVVALMFIYPALGANQLVGTDLVQAVPLSAAAALGTLAFGHVELTLTTSIIIGSVPAVFVGAVVSSRVPDRHLRPAVTLVILATGLKYVGVTTTELGSSLLVALVVIGCTWLVRARPGRRVALALRSASAAGRGWQHVEGNLQQPRR